jgi:hypothetical protein
MVNRKDLLEEQLLRKNIREAVRIVVRRRSLEEKYIRSIVKALLQEIAVTDKIPHASTGINILEELLKKIIPILQDSYLSLTTSEEQRSSFSNHIMNAAENSIDTADTNDTAISEAIEIDIDDEEEGDDTPPEFIDIEDDEVEEEEEIPEEEEFATGLEDQGLDKTGRNIAFQTYKQIEQQILDAYGILGNDEDRGVFREYLLINLKLYFEKFEEEMATNVDAPDVEVPEGSEEAGGGELGGEEIEDEEMDFDF